MLSNVTAGTERPVIETTVFEGLLVRQSDGFHSVGQIVSFPQRGTGTLPVRGDVEEEMLMLWRCVLGAVRGGHAQHHGNRPAHAKQNQN